MRKFLLIFLVLIMSLGVISCSKNEDPTEIENFYVSIDVKDYGEITALIRADIAPVTAANFKTLVESGFYDGLTFHRIMEGFMIQGGDPEGTGYGGSDNKIFGEFEYNGFENTLSHVRGTISMARSKQYNSASSQFFIVQKDSTYLDGQYAAFGTVLSGMETVDEICRDAIVEDNNGTVLAKNQPIISSIKIIPDANN